MNWNGFFVDDEISENRWRVCNFFPGDDEEFRCEIEWVVPTGLEDIGKGAHFGDTEMGVGRRAVSGGFSPDELRGVTNGDSPLYMASNGAVHRYCLVAKLKPGRTSNAAPKRHPRD